MGVFKTRDKCKKTDGLPVRDHLLFSVTSGSVKIADRETTIEVQSPEAYKFSELEKIFNVPNIEDRIKSYLITKEDYFKNKN